MNIKSIRNDDDLRAALKRLDKVFQAQEGTAAADEMEILVMLIEPYIGSSGRVSEILNYKRRLSLKMIKQLHGGLHNPYESLLSAV